jgi:hypothetical protein
LAALVAAGAVVALVAGTVVARPLVAAWPHAASVNESSSVMATRSGFQYFM